MRYRNVMNYPYPTLLMNLVMKQDKRSNYNVQLKKEEVVQIQEQIAKYKKRKDVW